MEIKKFTYEHRKNISFALKGKKQSIETRIKRSKSLKGRIPWNKGKKGIYSEEHKNRIIIGLKNAYKERRHSGGFKKGHKPWSKGLNKVVDDRLKNRGLNFRGRNHPNWKDGRSREHYQRIAYENNPKECKLCYSKRYLCVDHIDGNRRNNIIFNLQILCRSCHGKKHKLGRFLPKDGGWSKRRLD